MSAHAKLRTQREKDVINELRFDEHNVVLHEQPDFVTEGFK